MFCCLFTLCAYPSQSVKISIHSCTFSKNFPIRRLMPFQYIPFFLMLIYFVLYFVINSCANTLSVQSVSAEYVMYLCSFSCCYSFILFIFLFQERIKRSQQFGFIYHTACAPQYFSVSEKHQRRHGLDAVLACCYAVLIYIHLDDSDAVAQHTLYLLQNGVHRLARLAPCSKEIDQNKLATVYYIIECLHN